jgi:hypothetical protein
VLILPQVRITETKELLKYDLTFTNTTMIYQPLPHYFLKSVLIFCVSLLSINSYGQEGSVAESWNEACLHAISRDFARPTVHARNLFHQSIALYDAWAAYDPAAEPYLLGRTRGSYTSTFNGVGIPANPEEVEEARETAISYAAYRLIRHRFISSPGAFLTLVEINNLMADLGHSTTNTSIDYVNGGPAELGNFIAQQIINFGFTDGSNESADYANQYYEPINPNILPEQPGTNGIIDPNRWQAISLSVAIDQSGNQVSDPPFLSPEWGDVVPFSMTDDNKSVLSRDGIDWNVYYDPGNPPLLDTTDASGLESLWKWNFCLVNIWQSHLDPNDETLIDASPLGIGNIQSYPQTQEELPDFYNLYDGGTNDPGHEINPITGEPYEPQIVKRADYGRVVAEFWADGPNSTTPPGHWFEIYNELRHHPLFENKWMGEGPELNALEFDVKFYFTIGGAMHDAAIAAWSIKGYHDYLRPVSAVRYMCEMGQCTNPAGANFHAAGIPLVPGYIEQVEAGDALAGANDENVGKIKLYTWRGPDYIDDPEADFAGTGWILGENWWPYQRPSFVSPPFAGFISGHSTYSRTAAEIFTLITGSEYFPGGMSNFEAPQNDFLEFEVGPSETVFLQWATYRDASDQCSLSRIWGGIHPPADDVPGRLIGMELGPQAFGYANEIFNTDRPIVTSVDVSDQNISIDDIGSTFTAVINFDRSMNTGIVPAITFLGNNPLPSAISVTDVEWISDSAYEIQYLVESSEIEMPNIFMRIAAAQAAGNGLVQNVYLESRPFVLDTKRPTLQSVTVNNVLLNDASANGQGLVATLTFNEPCDDGLLPAIQLSGALGLDEALIFQPALSSWITSSVYAAHFSLVDNNEEIDDIAIEIEAVTDLVGNAMLADVESNAFSIDTRNPEISEIVASENLLNAQDAGADALSLSVTFDKPMNTMAEVSFTFPDENPLDGVLVLNSFASGWEDEFTYTAFYNQGASEVELFNINVVLANFEDLSANTPENVGFSGLFSIDTKKPEILSLNQSGITLSDADAFNGTFDLEITFTEEMNEDQILLIQLSGPAGIAQSMAYNPFQSQWNSSDTFTAVFNMFDVNVELEGINLQASFGSDLAGNIQASFLQEEWINIDTKNPEVAVLFANVYTVEVAQVGTAGFSLLTLYNESMDPGFIPEYEFIADGNPNEVLTFNEDLSGWENFFSYHAFFDVADGEIVIPNVGVTVNNAFDIAGNLVVLSNFSDFFDINLNTLSAAEGHGNNGIRIYPNPLPSGAPIVLEVGRSQKDARVRVHSMSGQLIREIFIPHLFEGKHQLSLPQLASGIYFATIESDAGTSTFKVVALD